MHLVCCQHAVCDRPNNEAKTMSLKNVKEWTDISETLLGKIRVRSLTELTVLYTVLANSLSSLLQV
jgi:hypothetical protein